MTIQEQIDDGKGEIIIPEGTHVEDLRVHRNCIIRGHSRLDCRIMGRISVEPGLDCKFMDFRLVNPGGLDPGFWFNNWFFGMAHGLLVENFQVGVNILAGQGWVIEHCYFAGCKFDIRIQNLFNPDTGDHLLFGNVHDGDGVACVHHLSSGGLRAVANKFLGHQYGVLGEYEGVTSDLLMIGNSVENQTTMGVALRENGGSFCNVTMAGNQFALNAPAIWIDNMDRVSVTGNSINCPGHKGVDLVSCPDSVEAGNAVTAGAPAPVEPPAAVNPWAWLFPWLR
jgi:hypothetical protein